MRKWISRARMAGARFHSPRFTAAINKWTAARMRSSLLYGCLCRILLDANRTVKDVRMVFASVAPFTLRAVQTEGLLRGRQLTADLIGDATRAIQDEIHPIDDIRSTQGYRRRVTANLVRDFLAACGPVR